MIYYPKKGQRREDRKQVISLLSSLAICCNHYVVTPLGFPQDTPATLEVDRTR